MSLHSLESKAFKSKWGAKIESIDGAQHSDSTNSRSQDDSGNLHPYQRHRKVTKFWPNEDKKPASPTSFWRKMHFIGRADKHWYIRLPLWAQSTILIVSIGFLSLFILLLVTALQVWQYSLNLMQERLSTTAGMVAISLEQQFSAVGSDMASLVSRPSVIDFIEAANRKNLSHSLWNSMDQEINVQVFLSKYILSAQLYDNNLNSVYTYTQRASSNSRLGQQSNLLPRRFYPLSNPKDVNSTLGYLANGYPAVLGKSTLSTSNATDSFLTYSLTLGITKTPVYAELGNLATSSNADWIGYATIVFSMPLSANSFTNSEFSEVWANAVRERDIVTSANNSHFKFVFADPYLEIRDSRPLPVSSFPVIIPAYDLAKDGSRDPTKQNDSINGYPFVSGNESSDRYDSVQPYATGRIDRRSTYNNRSFSNRNVTVLNNDTDGKVNKTSPFVGAQPSYVPPYTSLGKLTSAEMRTTSPPTRKASVGFSYANIITEQWLVFVAIREEEAFTDARSLRNKLIGVAVGVLGAVLVMVLPLSIWQTRGFYVVYQNMKLRPMFIVEELDDADEDKEGSFPGDSADFDHQDEEIHIDRLRTVDSDEAMAEISSPVSGTLSNSSRSDSRHTREKLSNGLPNHSSLVRTLNEPITPQASPTDKVVNPSTSKIQECDDERRSSHTPSLSEYRYTIPLPLPQLNRWFTDETDDLVETYNDMVERLNGQYLHLEDQVKSRTKEAQMARELREEANAAKSEFIAIITHELRTPLNGIMGLTAVSVDEEDIQKVRGALALIIESGRILMGLLNELLELSKSLVGVEPVVSVFSTTKLMGTLSDLFMARVGSLSVTFALAAVPEQLCNLNMRGDMDHIAQICLSFMSNAMKFSAEDGNVSVIAQLRRLDDPFINLEPYGGLLSSANGVLEILVTDSGVGISHEQLARIFDLFVQGDNPLRKNHKGAGLGMALSKHLAEGIGGYVTVYSAKDVGSTVVLRVPVEVLDSSAEQIQGLCGPPIEFKVKNVYATMSLHSGEVMLVQGSQNTSEKCHGNHHRSISKYSMFMPPNSRRSRHAHHISNGSKMLLTRAYPVAKLLSAHSSKNNGHGNRHGHQQSVNSLQSQSSNKVPTQSGVHGSSENSAADGSIHSSSHVQPSSVHAVAGSLPNKSASSLLLNLPPDLFDPDRQSATQRSSVISFNSDEMHGETDPPSPHRPARLMIPPRQLGAYYNRHSQSPSDVSGATAPGSASSDKFPAFAVSPLLPTGPKTPDIELPPDMRILLAEDNILNQSIMVKMLEQIGVSAIDTATDGDSVIKLVEDSIVGGFHYGLIFMDLSMPGTNGIEATNHIRGTLGYPYPIVALTGFTDLETRNACIQAHIQEVLTKPVMKHDIIRVLQKYKAVE